VDFMMRFELGLRNRTQSRPKECGPDRGFVHCGSLIPLFSVHGLASREERALGVRRDHAMALFGFRFVKGRFTGVSAIRAGGQTALIGGLAAAAAFGIARLIFIRVIGETNTTGTNA